MTYNVYEALANRVVINTAYIDPDTRTQFAEVYFTKEGGKSIDTIYLSNEHDGVHIGNSFFHPDDPKKSHLPKGLGAGGVNGGLFISANNIPFNSIIYLPDKQRLTFQ
ncbi:hypothetical protein [Chitinophaga rhizophila]|nr:hypothetical protein [Chitinophaga rhizophila]